MVAVVLAGCGKEEETGNTTPVQVPEHFVNTPPDGVATPIPKARKLAPGSEVILSGRVMGVKVPFVEGRALFVLGDEATITPCNEMDDDHCAIPWDACCDPIEVRAAGTVSIQLLGKDGNVLPVGLKGVGGLKELSRVKVIGKVAPMSTEKGFVVNASKVFVE